MVQELTLKIDGAPVRAPKGTSVLDAAVSYGICISHLCHVPNLRDVGACRLCIVENVKNGWSKITTSCTFTVQEGMVILTNTDKIVKLRCNIAERLVPQALNSRAIQDIAVRCGVKEVRYPFRNENCIQCGRCVRYCNENFSAHARGFFYALGSPRDFCKNCGSCILFCPMSVTPYGGPMKKGEERLCVKCESQISMSADLPGACVKCDLGKGRPFLFHLSFEFT